jgi:integrase/recombinase XerD
MTEGAVWAVVKRCVEAAGIRGKEISPHSLRHTFAIRTLRLKRNVVALQKLLGHSALTTTQRYVDHLQMGELRQAVAPLPTLARNS